MLLGVRGRRSLAAGPESRSQRLDEAVDVGEGVVERHRSDPQHAGLPHVALDQRHERQRGTTATLPSQRDAILTATPLFSSSR